MLPEVAQTPNRAECGDVWPPVDRDRWKLHFDVDDELVCLCPECDEREFGGRLNYGASCVKRVRSAPAV